MAFPNSQKYPLMPMPINKPKKDGKSLPWRVMVTIANFSCEPTVCQALEWALGTGYLI